MDDDDDDDENETSDGQLTALLLPRPTDRPTDHDALAVAYCPFMLVVRILEIDHSISRHHGVLCEAAITPPLLLLLLD